MMNRNPEAINTLRSAFDSNKGSPFIAVRLASLYENAGKTDDAIKVLSDCIDIKPADRYTNFNLAMLFLKYHPEDTGTIKIHLKRSFSDGDSNYAAQFWYARLLYIENPFGEAKKYFDILGLARVDPKIRDMTRGVITDNNKPIVFTGVVGTKEFSFGFIKRDGFQDSIFMHNSDIDYREWDEIKTGMRVQFEMGFSYRGAKGINVKRET
jgi:cold shock CspA family protein